MPNKLTIAFVAAALAVASFPAFAVDIPDAGSKNFSPPGDAPSYFTNENVPVSGRVADTTAVFETAVDEAPASMPAEVGSVPAARSRPGQHSKFVPSHNFTKHTLWRSTGKGRSTRYAGAYTVKGTKTASLHDTGRHTGAGSRTVSAAQTRTAKRVAATGKAEAGPSRTKTAKHTSAGARRA